MQLRMLPTSVKLSRLVLLKKLKIIQTSNTRIVLSAEKWSDTWLRIIPLVWIGFLSFRHKSLCQLLVRCLTFSAISCHSYISFIVMTHSSTIHANAGVWMSARRSSLFSERVPCICTWGISLNGKKPAQSCLLYLTGSARGIEGNKDPLVDHSCILVVTGCYIVPWE